MKWGCDVRISHFIAIAFQATRHQGLAGELGTGCMLSFWEDGIGAFGLGWTAAGCRGADMVVCDSHTISDVDALTYFSTCGSQKGGRIMQAN